MLSVLLSVPRVISRHRGRGYPAHRAVRQRLTGLVPPHEPLFGRLISVRSEVQLLSGPLFSLQESNAPRENLRAGRFHLPLVRRSGERYRLIFQKAIPLACCATSAVPTLASACRSMTSTFPGCAPTPSLDTKA